MRSNSLKAIGVGVLVSLLLSAIMVPLNLFGLAPFPSPPSLAFAQTVFGADLPMPVGLLFHVVYVTFWSYIYITYFSEPNSFAKTFLLAVILWAIVLVVFFPLIGWGIAGTAISPQLIIAAAVPHLLFAIFLWGGVKVFY